MIKAAPRSDARKREFALPRDERAVPYKIDAARLRGFLDCMHEEADARDKRSEAIRDIVKAAKEAGYDTKATRKVFNRERMDEGERIRQDDLLETYEAALGGKGMALRAIEQGTPIGEAAQANGVHRATVARARHVAKQGRNATPHDPETGEIKDAAPQAAGSHDALPAHATPQPAPEGGVGTGTITGEVAQRDLAGQSCGEVHENLLTVPPGTSARSISCEYEGADRRANRSLQTLHSREEGRQTHERQSTTLLARQGQGSGQDAGRREGGKDRQAGPLPAMPAGDSETSLGRPSPRLQQASGSDVVVQTVPRTGVADVAQSSIKAGPQEPQSEFGKTIKRVMEAKGLEVTTQQIEGGEIVTGSPPRGEAPDDLPLPSFLDRRQRAGA